MTVQSGASVVTGTRFSIDPALAIGRSAGALGSLAVKGSGVTFDAAALTEVSGHGIGIMTIENGATVITGGTTVTNGSGLFIADSAGSSGSVEVSGSGSSLTNTGELVIGGEGTITQPGGLGSLQIDTGATVITNPGTTTGPAADIASGPGTDGSSATVSGTGSTWTIGGALVVGDAAAGSLGITAGGTVSASSATIAAQSGAGGAILSVAGAGSQLAISGELVVGAASSGELSVANGATVTLGSLDLGTEAGSTGVIDLEGAGSLIQVSGTATLGGLGGAAVTIGQGATLSAAGIIINGFVVSLGGTIDPPAPIQNPSGSSVGGHGTLDGDVDNQGTVFAQGGTYEVTGSIYSSNTANVGELLINGGGDLQLDGSVDATQYVQYANNITGTLTIGDLADFQAFEIDGFSAAHSDKIVITGGFVGSTLTQSYNSSTHTLTLTDAASNSYNLVFGGSHTAADFTTNVAPQVPCFAAGTRIATTLGEVPVEELRVGDELPTLIGGAAAPIVWIGHRRVDCARHPEPRKVWPVRIRAGAFGPGVPARDLFLSPDHAIYAEEVLIPVRYLIDGEAIAQVPIAQLTYYHVELARHDVVRAEGLAAETFLDTGGRRMFDNGGGPVVLHPDFATRVWEAEGCAPLVVTGPEVIAVRRMAGRQPGKRRAG